MSVNQSAIGKAIAIIFVVFGHLGFIVNGGAIGVSIFLVLSGYGITKSAEKNNFILDNFWKKKFFNIYIPFLICSFGVVLFLYLIKSALLFDISKKSDIIMGMFGFPNNPYDPTMWYISFIFMMYISFWISFKLFKRNIYRVIICSVLCLIIGIIGRWIYSDSIGIYLYLSAFPIGVIIALFDEIIDFLCKLISSYRVIVYIIVILTFEYMSEKSVILYILLTFLVSLFAIPVLKRIERLNKEIILIIGRSSYAIYLIEGIIMRVMWEYIGNENLVCNFLCGIVIIILGISIHTIKKVCFKRIQANN